MVELFPATASASLGPWITEQFWFNQSIRQGGTDGPTLWSLLTYVILARLTPEWGDEDKGIVLA